MRAHTGGSTGSLGSKAKEGGESSRQARDSASVGVHSIEKSGKLKKYEVSSYIIDPSGGNSNFSRRWDLVITLLLLFTSTVTPYEVGFLGVDVNALFYINRIADMLFIIDIGINFHTAYYDEDEGIWITDYAAISRNYTRSWFGLDLISTIPFDVLGVILELIGSTNGKVDNLKVLRFLRILKLAKLLRVLRARRIISNLENSSPINYSSLSLLKFLVIILVGTHWLACGFSMVAKWDPNEPSWLDVVFEDYPVPDDGSDGKQPADYVPAIDKYVAAMYWSAMTISTIGYGDITPKTTIERVYGILCMLYGALLYGYIIGAVSGIVAARDARQNNFHTTMDQLNEYMTIMKLSPDLRYRLRDYFKRRFSNTKLDTTLYTSLLEKMSPALQGEVSLSLQIKWINNVKFVKHLNENNLDELTTILTLNMNHMMYPPSEVVIKKGDELKQMYIVQGGVVLTQAKVNTVGSVFGLECMLGEVAFSKFYAVTVNYAHISCIPREVCLRYFCKYPSVVKALRLERIKRIAMEEVIAYARACRILDIEEKRQEVMDSMHQQARVKAEANANARSDADTASIRMDDLTIDVNTPNDSYVSQDVSDARPRIMSLPDSSSMQEMWKQTEDKNGDSSVSAVAPAKGEGRPTRLSAEYFIKNEDSDSDVSEELGMPQSVPIQPVARSEASGVDHMAKRTKSEEHHNTRKSASEYHYTPGRDSTGGKTPARRKRTSIFANRSTALGANTTTAFRAEKEARMQHKKKPLLRLQSVASEEAFMEVDDRVLHFLELLRIKRDNERDLVRREKAIQTIVKAYRRWRPEVKRMPEYRGRDQLTIDRQAIDVMCHNQNQLYRQQKKMLRALDYLRKKDVERSVKEAKKEDIYSMYARRYQAI